ncbi:glycosyltransferase family 2 protein [Companilactobacillus sp.]|jgi:glycosyltransferase involved in cell wall biosynthesis|uniref:glycosyltransferase family 2 protein n=1 Tax=Companilactobacillus sp. TaxID=2767905 RepID=UPI0025BE3300|nr:glycosyltransferase family 2 protein [Companilactobacillus sp.]MCH4008944.1 glycosyltransferase family 2 protein [Companilactobacillus sp.]MCH4050877.1 glycosyltransferase family 2 protein [Companilactobacillus sp.]MCH4076887.1 glycosyltransferase family 2 protein [Companilactobacillus sp.]MCH4125462.1 glycosyltransferase family 2 protein [Companilactobacillus sp.]MCH4132004.1 glycosyltransferase family 2 protein [Companilactobacillus sp.]
MTEAFKLGIVVPCYNEEEVLPETNKELTQIISNLVNENKITNDSKIVFVDDGSSDKTWSMIDEYSKTNDYASGVKLSRNFGHQGALLAGVTSASNSCDAVVTIDADLQDDVNAIPKMVDEFLNGSEVVYGVRNNRQTDTSFKRDTAEGFYKVMGWLGVKLVPDSADFRLMSQRACKVLLSYRETNLFLRGIVPMVGFKSAKVYYARKERFAGTSKYPLRKMLKLAINGITSFSIVPIKMIMQLGFLIVLISIGLLIYTIVQKIHGNVVTGWSSMMISIWALGGVQLICISVIGEYVGKIFNEVKHRPRFTIERDIYTEKTLKEENNEVK